MPVSTHLTFSTIIINVVIGMRSIRYVIVIIDQRIIYHGLITGYTSYCTLNNLRQRKRTYSECKTTRVECCHLGMTLEKERR